MPRPNGDKTRDVLRALVDGCRTTFEIADYLGGVTEHVVHGRLYWLRQAGTVVRIGTLPSLEPGRRPQAMYGLAEPGRQA
jgi:DNA-binding Lrp family transcriptional regulator